MPEAVVICASVVAANTRNSRRQVFRGMLARTALDPEDAVEWGLVQEIRQQLFEPGAEVIPVQPGG